MNSAKQDFWNARAEIAQGSGTDDFVLQQLEERTLLEVIPERSRILDVGCGDGGLLWLAHTELNCSGVGVDFSAKFIERCREKYVGLPLDFECRSMLDIDQLGLTGFDVLVTKRSIINLDSWEQQRATVSKLMDIVKPGGRLLLLESVVEGLERLNALRRRFDLPDMEAPWHNRFLHEDEVGEIAQRPDVVRVETVDFASTYYFLSRVIYAHVAALSGESLRYDSPINLMSLELPSIGHIGAPRLHIIEKAH